MVYILNKNRRYLGFLLCTLALFILPFLSGCSRKMNVKFDYDSSNYVTKMPDYKGVEYTVDNTVVTDQDVDDYIESVKKKDAIWNTVSGEKVQMGDKVSITVAAVDNETGDYLTGFSMNDQLEIVLGENLLSSKYENFEEQLVGIVPGFTKNMICKVLPDPSAMLLEGYSDYVGKEIKFTVTIVSASRALLPALTDAYVQTITDGKITNEADYRAWVRRNLEKNLEEKKYNDRYQQVIDYLIDNLEVSSYPETVLTQMKESVFDKMNYQSAFANMEPEEYCQKYFGCSIEDYCKKTIRNNMVLQEVIKREKLTVTRREYEKNLDSLAKKWGYDSAEALKEEQDEDAIAKAMLLQKAMDVIYDNSVPKKES